jgi:hypothetical protein
MGEKRDAGIGERIKKRWRPILRAIHRDLGYVAVGLTFIYALSGLAVNHVKDWDPNFHEYSTTHELGTALPDDDDEAAKLVLDRLGIHEQPTEVYRANDEIEILLDHRTLHASTTTGHVLDEGQKPRFVLRFANWLHLNRGKKAWTYVADSYAAALLFLACSGMFMLAGKKGLLGRGAVFVLIGIAVPVVYVTLAGGSP